MQTALIEISIFLTRKFLMMEKLSNDYLAIIMLVFLS